MSLKDVAGVTGASARVPIGIVIPTLNVRERLAGWLPGLAPILALAEEVVVVDSHSEDGTLEYLRANLRHPRLRLLTHRRGLYQSWNFGLQQLRTEYAYIATVGECITVEGWRHLFEVAEALEVDVVVSPPEFRTLRGEPVPAKRWPIHDLLQWQTIRLPVRVAPVQVFLLSALETSECLLGSAASNLYRTTTLQRFPFPTQYGHFGDIAWSIQYPFKTSLAVTPRCFSRFLIHPSGARLEDRVREALQDRLIDLARQTLRETPPALARAQAESLCARLSELTAQRHEWFRRQERYDRLRQTHWPWIFNPWAWQARSRRNRQRALVRQLRKQIRTEFGDSSALTREPRLGAAGNKGARNSPNEFKASMAENERFEFLGNSLGEAPNSQDVTWQKSVQER